MCNVAKIVLDEPRLDFEPRCATTVWWQDRWNVSVPVFRTQFAAYCGCCHAFNLKKPWGLSVVTISREFTSYIAISYVVASESFISQCYQNVSLLQSVPRKSSVLSTLGSKLYSIQPCAYGCKMYNLTCVWEMKSTSYHFRHSDF